MSDGLAVPGINQSPLSSSASSRRSVDPGVTRKLRPRPHRAIYVLLVQNATYADADGFDLSSDGTYRLECCGSPHDYLDHVYSSAAQRCGQRHCVS